MKSNTIELRGVKFGKKGIRTPGGKYYPVSYSLFHKTSDGVLCVTVYAKSILAGLPAELNPENNSDMQSDYFETDKVRFNEGTPEFVALKPFCPSLS